MKKLYTAAAAYTAAGLLSGLYYRELTKLQEFTGTSQLGVVHTHLLVLGTFAFLLFLALEHTLKLSRSRWFGAFLWVYNAGVALTAAMLTLHGSLTVLGHETGPMLAGFAGLGHMLLTAGLVLLFATLRSRISQVGTDDEPQPEHDGEALAPLAG
jgi:hypothetical protein